VLQLGKLQLLAHFRSVRTACGVVGRPAGRLPVRVTLLLNALINGSGGGSQHKLPRPDYVAYVFACLGSTTICRLYKLTLSYQHQVTLHLGVGFSYLVHIKIFSRSAPAWEPEKIFFTGARTRSRRPCQRFPPPLSSNECSQFAVLYAAPAYDVQKVNIQKQYKFLKIFITKIR
jgi:hypothetical protein